MTARKKPTPLANKRNADDRVRDIVRAKNRCERCGRSSGPFEHAHIIRRRYAWTRTDERNGWCLCHDCHSLVDGYASEFNALVGVTIGWELHAELEAKSKRRDKFDWAAEVARLKALAKDVAA